MEPISLIIFGVILLVIYFLWGRQKRQSTTSGTHSGKIFDKFTNIEDVTDAIRKAGLESSNLIFGIDFTASNVHQGIKTNGGRSLHHIDMLNPNPYQRVMPA
ncbi:copine family protein 1-like isoform X2 [Ruditapes philippinarum]|uniref:copine family protein 1-like isoform X2 n=1 Tax=Ruditapes philippinarum TaxID=129788 RepID=UPI00295A5F57|nr:copine family protein 1-like isoform X2 [Ruditapes philippinarum]